MLKKIQVHLKTLAHTHLHNNIMHRRLAANNTNKSRSSRPNSPTTPRHNHTLSHHIQHSPTRPTNPNPLTLKHSTHNHNHNYPILPLARY